MKIEKLIIYGFGKHENVTVDLGSGITVLYGLNEAGKTTIQQFILHILFGFPQKNSATLRYEPKSGGSYGGQIVLFDDRYGKCIVERVRGKSAGDVTVHYQDGTKGGEDELNTLLRQYDRASFESIFSFSLLQLQGFDKMDEEGLSRTLLASGTTGVDSMLQLEKKMEKEMGDLFKKSGKNPEMNVKISELRELEIELRDAQEKMSEYAPAIERIREIDGRLTELNEQKKGLQQDGQQLALIRQLLPLHHKRQTLESRLSEVTTANFPADGIRRFETLSGKWVEAKAAKQRMEDERLEMAARIPESYEPERISKMEVLLAGESEWHGWRTAVVASEDEKRRLMSLKKRLLDRLGAKGEEVETLLIEANVSIRKEEQMHELIGDFTGCNQQIEFTKRQLVQLENEMTHTEKEHGFIERSAPSAEEVERAHEWPAIRQRLAEAKAYVSFGGSVGKQNSMVLSIVLFLLAVAILLFGFIQKEGVLVVGGILLGSVGIFLYSRKGVELPNASKLREMEKFIAAYDGNERQMEELAERIRVYRIKKADFQQAFIGQEQNYLELESELNVLQNRRGQTETELLQFLAFYGFDGLPSPNIVPELFRMIRDVQEVARDMEDNEIRLQVARKSIYERTVEVEQAVRKKIPQEAMYEIVRREFTRLTEDADLVKSLTAGIERIETTLKETSGLASSLQEKLQALLAEAGVNEEEGFYRSFDAHQESILLKGQIEDVRSQLAMHSAPQLPEGVTEDKLVTQVAKNEGARSSIEEELNALINEKAALVNKSERLLTDETYGRKRQQFEMKKEEFSEMAKKWSERKVVSEAIRRTMMELKEKKLPEVLQTAEKLFERLTGGTYSSLQVTEKGYFEAVASSGMRYPIIELSQATKEQAYISLRFALAASLQKSAPFPIIIDDPFVHFDAERLSRMIELLDELQNNHQFIYFTCHKAMKKQWLGATTINVSEIGSGQGEFVS